MGVPHRCRPVVGGCHRGSGVYLGAGTSLGTVNGKQVPPQAIGVWGFTDLQSAKQASTPQ